MNTDKTTDRWLGESKHKLTMGTTDERRGLPSASGMARLAACPDSHRAQQGLPDTGDAASSAGTAIHAVLAGTQPMDSLTPEQQDIAEACQRIADTVMSQWMERHRIDPATVTVIRDSERIWLYDKGQKVASGLADVIAFSGQFGLLLDFKTMAGDHGTAADNMQLRALAVMASNTYDLAKIDVAIIQPLVTHTPEVCSYDWPALMRAEEELLGIVAAANAPDAPRNAGDHCRYCKAAATCHAVHREIKTLATLTIQEPGLTVSDAEIAALRDKCGAAKKMIAHIQAEAFRRAELDPAGWRALGWEIAAGKGRRTVDDVATVCERLHNAGASWQDITKACSVPLKNVESLARQATGAKGMALKSEVENILAGCVETKTGKPTLKRIGATEDEDE